MDQIRALTLIPAQASTAWIETALARAWRTVTLERVAATDALPARLDQEWDVVLVAPAFVAERARIDAALLARGTALPVVELVAEHGADGPRGDDDEHRVPRLVDAIMRAMGGDVLRLHAREGGRVGMSALADTVLQLAPVAILVLNRDGGIAYLNPHLEALCGFDLEEVIGLDWVSHLVPTRHQDRIAQLRRDVLAGRAPRGHVNPIRTRDGGEIEIEWHNETLHDARGRARGLLAIGIDVSARERALREQREGEQRYRSVVETTPDGFWVTDPQGRFLEVNAVYCAWSGYTRDELLGRTISLVEARETAAETARHLARVTAQGHDRFETLHRRKDGSVWSVEITVSCNRELGQQFIFVRDLTRLKAVEAERAAAEAAIRHMAFHDALTGLPNRRLLGDRLAQAAAALGRDGGLGGMLFIDLDDFKGVNDRLGHEAGDALLVAVAGRLRQVVREADTVARIGGDEFVIMLPRLPESRREPLDTLGDIACQVGAAVEAPVTLVGRSCRCRASIGAAVFAHGDSVDRVLARADAAMYVRKTERKRGRG